ncbi:hypothetical protein ACO0QE_003910 [Hanseniaspora vineae]
MASLPTNSETLSKYLRSKQIKVPELISIVDKSYNGIYFPRGDLFVFELLVDRFNEQSNNTFLGNAEIWGLFNNLWDKVLCNYEATFLIRVYKKLRMYQILTNLQPMLSGNSALESQVGSFLDKVKESSLSVDLPQPDMAFKLVCGFAQQTPVSVDTIDKLLLVVDFDSKADQSRFLQYLCFKAPRSLLDLLALDDTKITSILYSFVLDTGKVDGPQTLTKLLEKTIKTATPKDSATLVKLFEMVVKSNSSFTESVFQQISKISQNTVPELLDSLAHITKKNLISEEILNEVLTATLSSDNIQWALVTDVLKLNIELGIKNSTLILENVEKASTTLTSVWEQFVQCYVNAREFHVFVTDVLQTFSEKHSNSKLIFDSQYASIISKCVSNLSSTQLLSTINKLLDAPQLLLLIIRGSFNPVSLQYIKDSSDLKTVLHNIIFSDTFTQSAESTNWELIFNVMELYYSCFNSQEDTDDIKDHYESLVKTQQQQTARQQCRYSFFTLFKLRELIDLPDKLIFQRFMDWFSTVSTDKEAILFDLFTRWSSLINFVFDKTNLNFLCDELVTKYPNVLHRVLTASTADSNDFFEEEEVIYELVSIISNSIIEKREFSSVDFVCSIPVQCWNKNIRVALINFLAENLQHLSNNNAIIYLLKDSPTFKSTIETNFSELTKSLEFGSDIFECVWANHLTRWKESISYLNESLSILTKNFENDDCALKASLVVILSSHSVNDGMFIESLDKLLHAFVAYCYQTIQSKETSIVYLYKILSSCEFLNKEEFIQDKIKPLFDSDTLGTFSVEIEKLDLANEARVCDIFSLYLTTLSTESEILTGIAHYLVLKSNGFNPQGFSAFIKNSTKSDAELFQGIFEKTVQIIGTCGNYKLPILEVYQSLLEHIPSKNEKLVMPLARSVGQLISWSDDQPSVAPLVPVLETIKNLVITQQWVFSQYTIESLFPLCCKTVSQCNPNNETELGNIIEVTTQLLSIVLNFHSFRLTNRYHLINSIICFYMDVLSNSSHVSVNAVQNVSRLIINYCEPSTSSTVSKNSDAGLHSKVSLLKKNLRRSVGPVLLKYIKLCVSNFNPLSNSVRKELIGSIYSVFALLSQDELVTINASLDHAGKTYFKKIYEDFKTNGKWRED